MTAKYKLDAHGELLLQQYHERKPIYERLEEIVAQTIEKALKDQGLYVTSIEHRIKAEHSLMGKLELKGMKYHSLEDITDILGMRVTTFYTDDVDKVAAIIKKILYVDWNESVDKRKQHQLNSFGYNSLHYICRLPKDIVYDPEMPELNEYRFEIQMRTALQHVWSTIEHDIGYKSGIKAPPEFIRQLGRLAGMLELADDEFSRLRNTITDYKRRILSLAVDGKLDQVPLSLQTFREYLSLHPFDRLNRRIAAINQAEICEAPLLPFLPVLESFGFETLGEVDRFISEHSEDAYQMAVNFLAVTDLDILSETVGLQNLCIVHTLKQGNGTEGVKKIFEIIGGPNQDSSHIVNIIMEQARKLPFMNK